MRAFRADIGLRGKSILVIICIYGLVAVVGSLVASKAADSLLDYFGVNFARKAALLHKERILAPILRELTLSRVMAGTVAVRAWMRHEDAPDLKRAALTELEGYKSFFHDHSYFLAFKDSRNFYFNDAAGQYTGAELRHVLSPDDPGDVWFFTSMALPLDFNLNVDTDKTLGLTKLWINVAVGSGADRLGIVGTGMDITGFIQDFISTTEPGVSAILIDRGGAIQAHQNIAYIDHNTLSKHGAEPKSVVFSHLAGPAEAAAFDAAMRTLAEGRADVATLWLRVDGRTQLAAVTFMPEIGWYVVTFVDIGQAFNLKQFVPHLLFLACALSLFVVLVIVLLNRFLLSPLITMTRSASAIAAGDYNVCLPAARRDEIGQLSRAFVHMAATVRDHTESLERRVLARTEELQSSNHQLEKTTRHLLDSINYALMIQSSLLPGATVMGTLCREHFVLWRPRDIVGGDLYFAHQTANRAIIGIVDCIGHGVPGAFMTMMVHAVVSQAFTQTEDPGKILDIVDRALRTMTRDGSDGARPEIGLDMALCLCDPDYRRLVFAGARISLHLHDGTDIIEIKGERRSLGNRRNPENLRFANHVLALSPDHTVYLATDGFLDQAGGTRGYGFGSERFRQMLREHARLPLAAQGAAFNRILLDYQGDRPQRDDITVIGFRPAIGTGATPLTAALARQGGPMDRLDLFDMRGVFNRQEIMICFNGPFSRSIIEELGTAVKRYLENAAVQKGAMHDVFAVYIEQTQNVRNYVTSRYPDDPARQSAIVMIARDADNYAVYCGNVVDRQDGETLVARIQALRHLDKAQLRALFKEQARRPRDPAAVTGAGLGLVDMARKAARPLEYSLQPIDGQHSFFTLRVVV